MGNCYFRPLVAQSNDQQRKKGKKKANPFLVDYGLNNGGGGGKLSVLSDPTGRDIGISYELGPELGRREFGVTYLYTDKSTIDTFACKSISKKKLRTVVDIEDVKRAAAVVTKAIMEVVQVCNTLDSLNAHFPWGNNKEGKSKAHLINWKRICRPLNVGGLGTRKATLHNQSLLAKLFWYIIKEPKKLWARNLMKNNLPKESIMTVSIKVSNSGIRKGFLEPMTVIKYCCMGNPFDIWEFGETALNANLRMKERHNGLRLLAEEAATTEDEAAGVQQRESRRYLAN
ncbi:hypothetical protein GIB67_035491 [Kingdonia uniflora]|uniref:Uncharacterized protein n=1 Tax=Kingdonia uniflora TaxID=39325 RepID=A0A7J7P0G2_9MAGN|nr:hypothetical protein GIB67_035491 [Kingdonia uniflora]